ncbi:MAG: hypothetical protein WBM43_07775 [Flavobacteriaceae bacterium]
MKTKIKGRAKTIFKLATLALFVISFSCSPETELNAENLDANNARSRNKNDRKSQNADLKTLVKGAKISTANGLDVGPDGYLYVASVVGEEIVVMNKNNGKIIKSFGPSDGVLGPDDLIFSPDGSALYWTDILVGQIGRMDMTTGAVIKQFVAPGVNPIRFSEDGRLFTALDFLGDGLFELDPDLIDPPRHIISCPPPANFGLGFFNSFDTRMEGDKLMLYGPLFALNLVIAIDVDAIPDNTIFPPDLSGLFSGPIRIVAGTLGDSDLFNPAAAKFGPDGLLYVLDQAGKLWKVNPDGSDDKTLFTTLQPGLDNMTFDDDGTLYMTNNDEGWVAEILPSGQARYISPGGMIAPQGLAVMAGPNNQDMLFEADLFRLRQFNGTSGRQENTYKGYLIPVVPDVGIASMITPMNLSLDGEDLIITSWFSGGVQVWNPVNGVTEYYPDFTSPMDAIRYNGDIIVSNQDVIEGIVGLFWASSGDPIDLGGVLALPGGLETDGETIWVADWFTGTIWEVVFDGTTPESWSPLIDGLSNPEGLALDHTGGLLVVEWGASRLSRVDLATGERSTVVDELKLGNPGVGAPPMWSFDGVAVGPSGDIYISGAGINVIYKVPQK